MSLYQEIIWNSSLLNWPNNNWKSIFACYTLSSSQDYESVCEQERFAEGFAFIILHKQDKMRSSGSCHQKKSMCACKSDQVSVCVMKACAWVRMCEGFVSFLWQCNSLELIHLLQRAWWFVHSGTPSAASCQSSVDRGSKHQATHSTPVTLIRNLVLAMMNASGAAHAVRLYHKNGLTVITVCKGRNVKEWLFVSGNDNSN